MSIEKMNLINIAGLVSEIDDVLLACCEQGCFHIESSARITSGEKNADILKDANPYTETLHKLTQIENAAQIKFEMKYRKGISKDCISENGNYVSNVESQLTRLRDQLNETNKEIELHERTLLQIQHLKGLNVDFERIFKCERIKATFGKLPVESYRKLEYYNKETFFFVHYDQDKVYYWGVYFCSANDQRMVDDIFDSLYFKKISLPDFVQGKVEDAIENLKTGIEEKKKLVEELTVKIDEIAKAERDKLNEIYIQVKILNESFELRKHVTVFNDKFIVIGFVPQVMVNEFVTAFDCMNSVSVEIMPAEADQRLTPPVKLKNGKISGPFKMFIEMYGLPKYNGFNPTSLVAFIYILLFGIMFGDLGQGIVVSLLGLIITKKTKNGLGPIMTRVGISSAFFGLIYGSVFGLEEALNPLYKMIGLEHKPLEVMENNMLILGGAVAIGILIIILAIVLNIVFKLKNKNYESAVFGNNGLIGLLFYSALIYGIVSTVLFSNNVFTAPYIIGLLVIPVLVMFFREPLGCMVKGRKFESEGVGNFIISNFFELFEFLLGYASNTLSFVRIGGFVLSHAGMMSVVIMFTEGASKGVSPIILILGNIFVMGMEGLLVGIQVLRLNFYEFFSRFYETGGQPYNPVGIECNSNKK